MNTTTSSTKAKAETIEATYGPVAYTTLFNKGLERFAEVSKTSFDSALVQNAEILITYKKTLKGSSNPGLFLFDLAGQVFERYLTLQKSLLNLSVEQSTAVIQAAQECSHDASKAKAEITKVVQHSVDRAVEAQKSVVDVVVKQTQSATVNQQSIVAKPVQVVKNSALPAKKSLNVVTVKPKLGVAAKPLQAVATPVQRAVTAPPANAILKVPTIKPQPVISKPVQAAKPVAAVTNSAQRAVPVEAAKETPKVASVKQQPGVIAKPVATVEDSVQLRVDTLLAKEIVDLAIKPSKPSGPVN